MFKKLFIYSCGIIICFCNSFVLHAQTKNKTLKTHDWSVLGSYGYSSYYHFDWPNSRTPSGRLAVAKKIYKRFKSDLGLELGIQQNGVAHYSESNINPGRAFTTYPMVDALATLQTPFFMSDRLFSNVKAGIAYTNWRAYQNGVDQGNQQGLAAEVQAGIGYIMNDWFNLSILYQGLLRTSILGGNHTALTNNLPAQDGVLISLGMSI